MILVSTHGEMIDEQFYLVPYDFDARSSNAGATARFRERICEKGEGHRRAWQSTAAARRLPFRRGRRRRLGDDPDARSCRMRWTWKT